MPGRSIPQELYRLGVAFSFGVLANIEGIGVFAARIGRFAEVARWTIQFAEAE